ncbi:hypothetical protein HY642_06115 [Candidatus Woesearchaeota archaeon]|nr:hypothetical protein [Candidatus Woesearchaeota archaeon]
MKFVFDTSALLSLAAGGILELTTASIDCVIPERVAGELRGLSRERAFEGNLAREVLDFIDNGIMIFEASKSFVSGEMEAARLAKDRDDVAFLITDDVASLEIVEKQAGKPVRFSTAIVYALCLKKKLTLEQGWNTVERMSVNRNWKDNAIVEHAKIMWKK